MNTRTARPLLGVAIAGALLLGTAFTASPALAADRTGAASTMDAPELAPASHAGQFIATNEPAPAPVTRSRQKVAADDPVPGAPTGTYTLNADAAWAGQAITLTETAVSANTATRTVNWGDGSAPVTLAAGQTTATKSYATAGPYTVSVTLADATGATAPATIDKPVVAISVPSIQVNKSAVWLHENFRTTISGVQSITSTIAFEWGDGYTNTFPGRSGYIDSYYYHGTNRKRVSGVVTLRATFSNKLGTVTISTTVNIRPDGWRPTVKASKPKNANRVSSWKYARGTAADKGSGLDVTYVWISKITGKKVYCYTPSKKWKRVYNETQLNNCAGIVAKVTKGKWAVRILGLKKGSTVYVDAISWDWSDNRSKQSSTQAKLTR